MKEAVDDLFIRGRRQRFSIHAPLGPVQPRTCIDWHVYVYIASIEESEGFSAETLISKNNCLRAWMKFFFLESFKKKFLKLLLQRVVLRFPILLESNLFILG